MRSHLLTGKVTHTRVSPRAYRFEHDVFYLALDIDEIEAVDRGLTLFSYNHANFVYLLDRDQFDGGPLGERAREVAGVPPDDTETRITMVVYPRVAGYVFNPVTFYLVRSGGALERVVAEVHNTHGERFNYVLTGQTDPETGLWTAAADKQFYVSPFIAPKGHYTFTIRETKRSLDLAIDEYDESGQLVLRTGARLQRRRLTNRALAKAALRVPLVGLKTTVLIHFHALRLWRSGLRFYSHQRAAQ